MRSRRFLATGVLLLTMLTGGCFSVAGLHTARPIEPGSFQIGAAFGAVARDLSSLGDATPTTEFQLRYGLSERVDIGLQLLDVSTLFRGRLNGVSLDVNCALWLGEDMALAIDPTIEAYEFGRYYWLPLLWDFYESEDLTLTAALRPGWFELTYGDGDQGRILTDFDIDSHLIGVGLMAKWRVAAGLSLVPEVRYVFAEDTYGLDFVTFSLGLLH
ncbi:MAG: hypothetical protein KDE27_01445 [Planctomycetes bacterium]|nr:hypothetical protein [Planctomycetota bacterium]